MSQENLDLAKNIWTLKRQRHLQKEDFRKYNSKMVQLWYNIKVNVFANKSLRVYSGC
jgi:hypothetical protein